ncbi:Exocyst complex component 7 [Morus notabilis]|uniref:Exocyst subunit Exo70 family protein n=1 Tax=Morus notabilis TaxID=981085 RepID=W9QIQ6_9ROSA|nr:exocyst complex component EXO70E2 [Morus notabilis]EXB38101.1 Exocyst complex component 7 [Morus notabilis]
MADCKSAVPELEGEEDLIAAAKSIARALGSKKNLTDEARKILVDLGTQLSSIAIPEERKDEGICEIESLLDAVQEKVMSWESDQSMIWDAGLDEAFEYLNAADKARKLTERLESLCLSKGDCDDDGGGHDEKRELQRRAYDVLQMAMDRLDEEFRYMLVQNRQPFEPEHMSFRSSEDETLDEGSINSYGDDSFESPLNRDSLSRVSEEFLVDLVHPHVLPELRSIANLMFNSKYDRECVQTYTSLRKDALDECLFILEMEKLSIDDVLRMEWTNLNSKIRRWIWAMKIFVRVYLASEKWLCDQIFGELGPISLVCFIESSKTSILQLLNFSEAMSIGPQQPEKLFRILDMYEVLGDLIPDIEALYMGEAGSSITAECHQVFSRLGNCVRATCIEFQNAILSNHSNNPISGGGIHPLTRYVMNYIRTLTDYSETLNLLFKDHDDEGDHIALLSPDASPTTEEEDKSRVSPMARYFVSLAVVLERNLDAKCKLYKEISLQHLFLMNNIHYMAQKVKGSELNAIFGSEWIKKCNGKFQHHAMDYQRATWGSILSLFKDEGIQNPGLNSISKIRLKERFRSFYLAFEEIYRTQTAWIVPDIELREDLRISTSLQVIQAYRTFAGRHSTHINDKSIKYSADDLENFLLDLFEGSPKSLQNPGRR